MYATEQEEERALDIIVEFANTHPGIRRLFGIRTYNIVERNEHDICFSYLTNNKYHYDVIVDLYSNSVSCVYKVYHGYTCLVGCSNHEGDCHDRVNIIDKL